MSSQIFIKSFLRSRRVYIGGVINYLPLAAASPNRSSSSPLPLAMVLLVQTGGFASLAHIATYLRIGLIDILNNLKNRDCKLFVFFRANI
jgi:hypothetical protein